MLNNRCPVLYREDSVLYLIVLQEDLSLKTG
jgi:hypothetical protein